MNDETVTRITLTDGATTFEGRRRCSFGWWAYKLDRVKVATPQGPVEADGAFYVPRRSVLFVQVVTRGADRN